MLKYTRKKPVYYTILYKFMFIVVIFVIIPYIKKKMHFFVQLNIKPTLNGLYLTKSSHKTVNNAINLQFRKLFLYIFSDLTFFITVFKSF